MLVAVLIAAFVLTRRSGDEITPPGVVLIGVALLVALFTAVITPVDPVFGVVAHKVRWLWALGAFIAAVLVGAVLQRRGAPIHRHHDTRIVGCRRGRCRRVSAHDPDVPGGGRPGRPAGGVGRCRSTP